MADPKYNFLYCQKIVLFSENFTQVLLAKRQGEQDYDGVFTFVGGKMEASDESIVRGMQREKDEEIGAHAQIRLYADSSYNILFRKADGSNMILPHYVASFVGGEIALSDEYEVYKWVAVDELDAFEPKIENIPKVVDWALRIKDLPGQATVII